MEKKNIKLPKPGYPNGTSVLNFFIDEEMCKLTGNAVKVYLFFCRRSLAFPWLAVAREDPDAAIATLEAIAEGTINSNGEIIDRGTGLSRDDAFWAIRDLELASLVEAKEEPGGFGYRLRIDGCVPVVRITNEEIDRDFKTELAGAQV